MMFSLNALLNARLPRPLQAGKFCGRFAKCWQILTACGLLLPQASLAAPSIPNALRDSSLIYCTSIAGLSFNPQKADVGSNMDVVTEQIYDKLLDFDANTQSLTPALAERYEISADGREILFYLRKNVAFHRTEWFTPTRKFNAEDVVFSLNRVLGRLDELPALNHEQTADNTFEKLQAAAYHNKANREHYPYFESMALRNRIESVSAVNAHTVKIRLNTPDTQFLYHLASQYAVMLSKEYALQLNADDNLAQLDVLPIGTGVYQLRNYTANDYIRLAPNPNYWGKKANIQNLVVDFSTNGTGRMAKLMNRECDVVAYPEPSQIYPLRQLKSFSPQIEQADGANLSFIAFNMRSPKMQDLHLRQRIAQAIDRKRMVSRLFYGRAEVADNVLPTLMYSPLNLGSYHYPLLKAEVRKTAEENDRLQLWVVDESRIFNPHPSKMAEMIRTDLAKIGIQVELRTVTRAYIAQQLAQNAANYDMILTGWLANNADPTGFLTPILSCQTQFSPTNLARWCNEEFDHWLKLVKLSHNPQAQTLLLRLAQQQLEQELPILPLVHANHLVLANAQVSGLNLNPFGLVRLSALQFSPVEKTTEKDNP